MEFFHFNNSGIDNKIPSVQSGYHANKNRLFSAVEKGSVTPELFWFAKSTKIFFFRT